MTEKKREEKNIVRMLYVYVDKIEFEKEKKKESTNVQHEEEKLLLFIG